MKNSKKANEEVKPTAYTTEEAESMQADYMNRLIQKAIPQPYDGEEVLIKSMETYDIVYNFDELNGEQSLSAITAFERIDKLDQSKMPSFNEQINNISNDIRQIAFENILLRKYKKADGVRDFDLYKPLLEDNKRSYGLFKIIKSKELRILLEIVKPDFFYKQTISQSNFLESVIKLALNSEGKTMSEFMEMANQSVVKKQ